MACRGVVTELANLPPSAHLDAEALGQILGRCKKSVYRAVRRGELPPPVKFMGKHIWLVSSILNHMEARQQAVIEMSDRRSQKLSEKRP
jgi:predicted DNA-binding transcriptional regulator AlpA